MHHSWLYTAVLFVVLSLLKGIGKHLEFRKSRKRQRTAEWADYRAQQAQPVQIVRVETLR